MAKNLKIQGEVTVRTDGAEASLNRIGDTVASVSQKMEQAGDRAGKSFDGIGEGASQAAEKLTYAEKKMLGSIKRVTESIETVGKTASQKLEYKIEARGLDAAKFEPYLAKLREVELAQARLATSSQGAFSRNTANNINNVAYQVQDFAVQVNGGTDAMRALAVQLPQVFVGMGTFGAVVGVAAALLPNLLQSLGLFPDQSKKFGEALGDFNKVIGETGQAVKTFDMDGLYEQFNAANLATRAAIIEQTRFQQTFIETQRLVAGKKLGESVSDLGNFGTFAKLTGASPADRLAKELGISAEIAKDFLPALNGLKAGTEDVNNVMQRFGAALLSGNAEAQKLVGNINDLAKAERDSYAASSALSEAQAKMAKGHVTTKKEADAAAKSSKDAAKEAEKLFALIDKINGKASGLDANYWQDLSRLEAGYRAGAIGAAQYAEVVGELTRQQPFHVAFLKQTAEAFAKLNGEAIKSADRTEEGNSRLREEIAVIGLSADEHGRAAQAKLAAAAASDLATASAIDEAKVQWELLGVQREVIAGYEQLAEAKRRSAAALATQGDLQSAKASAEFAAKAAENTAKAWDKMFDDIERGITDSIIRGLEEGGNSGSEVARKAVVNALKTIPIKIAVSAVVSPVFSAARDVLGVGGSSQSAGLFGSLSSNASNASTLYGAANGSSGNMLIEAGNMLGSSSLGLVGTGANIGWSSANTAASAYSAAGMTGEALALQVGAVLPYLSAALAAAQFLGLFGGGGGPKTELFGGDRGVDWGLAVTAPMSSAMDDVAAGVEKQFNAILADFGKAAQDIKVGIGGDADPSGKSGSTAGYYVDVGGVTRFGQAGVGGLNASSMQLVAQRALLAALESSDINQVVNAYLDTLNVGSLTAEQSAAALAAVANLKNVQTALEGIGFGADSLTTSLVSAFGGLDQLTSAVDSYYTAYFSQEEQVARQRKQLELAFSSVGQTLPKTRAEYRSLVESLMQAGGESQAAAVQILGLQEAFGQLADAAEAVTRAQLDQVASARNALLKSYTDEISVLKDTQSRFSDFAGSIADMKQSLLLGDLSPLTGDKKYFVAKDNFESVASRAQLGDVSAIANLQSAYEAFLGASRQRFASGDPYTQDAARVLQVLDATESLSVRQARIASDSLNELEDQTAALAALNETALSIADAQAALAAALAPLAAQGYVAAAGSAAAGQTYASPAGAAYNFDAGTWGFSDAGTTPVSSAEAKRQALALLADQGPQALYDAAKRLGVSLVDVDAIMGWRSGTAAGWAQAQGLPAFAAGGNFSGGLALVGERGPEVVATGPARIWDNATTERMLSGASPELLRAFGELLAEVRGLRAQLGSAHGESLRMQAAVAERTAGAMTDAARETGWQANNRARYAA